MQISIIALIFAILTCAQGVIHPEDNFMLFQFGYSLTNFGALPWQWGYDLCDPTYSGYIPNTNIPTIVCDDGDLQRVLKIQIPNMGLYGTIPSEFGSLPSLTTLILNDNHLSGKIPRDLNQLSNLVEVQIQNNFFTGSFPFDIDAFPFLTTLIVGGTNNFCPSYDFENITVNDYNETVFCYVPPPVIHNVGSSNNADNSGAGADYSSSNNGELTNTNGGLYYSSGSDEPPYEEETNTTDYSSGSEDGNGDDDGNLSYQPASQNYVPPDFCSSNPCQNAGACDDNSTSCDCTGTGYTGDFCETMLFCTSSPCQNGGSCDSATSSCDCTGTGYTGDVCETMLFCTSNPCQHGGSCNDTPASCDCTGTGYTGNFCQTMLFCTSSPCQNGGSCNSASSSCDCTGTGYTGNFCQTMLFCTSSPCQNGGSCNSASSSCDCTGTGYTGNFCQTRASCPSTQMDNAAWPKGTSLTKVYGTCSSGFIGQPSRMCLASGSWGDLLTPCYPASNTCSAQSYANADWAATSVGTTSTGSCSLGYSGTPTRKCFQDSTWSTSLITYCQRNQCSATTEGNGAWPLTVSLSTAYGTCQSGYFGSIQRTCQSDGTWGPISGTCQPTTTPCGAETYAKANWTVTPAGQTAIGTCTAGYTGAPTRICNSNGVWQTLVTNQCSRIQCSANSAVVNNVNVVFPVSLSNTNVLGTCAVGSGKVYRFCDMNGNWAQIAGSCK